MSDNLGEELMDEGQALAATGVSPPVVEPLSATLEKVAAALAAHEARLQAIEAHFKQVLHVDLTV